MNELEAKGMKEIENVWKCRACGKASEKKLRRHRCPYCGSEDLQDAIIVKELVT